MQSKSSDIIQFTLIYNSYKSRVYNYVIRMVNEQMICEDIVQNVFLKLFENLQSIKNRNSIIFWIFKTARNEVFEYYRKKKVKLSHVSSTEEIYSEIDANEDLQKSFELREIKEIILKKLEHLPHEQKEVFVLKEFGELSYKEIASVMEIDENLVKSRLYKTRQKLIKNISHVI